MRRAADIYFAGGAQRVILPYNERLELTRRGDYRAIDEHPLRANDPLLLSYHPQGTLRMGVDHEALGGGRLGRGARGEAALRGRCEHLSYLDRGAAAALGDGLRGTHGAAHRARVSGQKV